MAKDTSRSANITFNIQNVDASRQNIGQIRGAVEGLGDDGKKAAQGLVDAFENIEKAEDRLTKKISSGRQVTTKDAGAMIQQFELLKTEIDRAFGSIANAPKEIQEAFQKSGASLDRTKQKVRDLTDAVDDQKGTLKEGGEQFTTMGEAMERAAGKYGKLVAGAGLFTAALKAGWDQGMKFNEWAGTDMSLFNEWLDGIAQKVGAIVRSSADGLVAIGGVISALTSGSISEMRTALSSLATTGKEHLVVLADAVRMNANEFAKAHPHLAAHTAAVKENAASVAQAKQELDAFQLAQLATEERLKKMAEAEAKLTTELGNTTEGMKKQNGELLKHQMALLDAEQVVINRTSDMNDPMTLAAIQRQTELEGAISRARWRMRQLRYPSVFAVSYWPLDVRSAPFAP